MDIQVGQQWRTRAGGTVTVVSRDSDTTFYKWNLSSGHSVDDDGAIIEKDSPREGDLVALINQAAETHAPAQPDTLRLTIAASIYAGMLTTAEPVLPDDAVQALRDLARRALSHADILIQEAAR